MKLSTHLHLLSRFRILFNSYQSPPSTRKKSHLALAQRQLYHLLLHIWNITIKFTLTFMFQNQKSLYFVPNYMILRFIVWMFGIEVNRTFSREKNVELSLFSGWSTDHLYQETPAHGQFEIIIHPQLLKPRVIAFLWSWTGIRQDTPECTSIWVLSISDKPTVRQRWRNSRSRPDV